MDKAKIDALDRTVDRLERTELAPEDALLMARYCYFRISDILGELSGEAAFTFVARIATELDSLGKTESEADFFPAAYAYLEANPIPADQLWIDPVL